MGARGACMTSAPANAPTSRPSIRARVSNVTRPPVWETKKSARNAHSGGWVDHSLSPFANTK